MKLLILLYYLTMAWSLTSANGQPDLMAIASDATAPHDGQPGCAIRYEFRRLWRNNFNPENFWECTRWRVAATQRFCPAFTRFQESWQTCVPENMWEWTPYMEPPTRPGSGQVEECDELEIDPCDCETPTVPTPTTPSPGTSEVTSPGTTPVTSPGTSEVTSPGTTPVTSPGTSEVTSPGTSEVTTPTQGTTPGGPGENPDPDGRCPGATDEQHDPGTMSCSRPECTMDQWLDGTLYPTRDPTYFFQCGPGTGNVFVMPCGPATCFSFRHQVCIHVRDWRNDCA